MPQEIFGSSVAAATTQSEPVVSPDRQACSTICGCTTLVPTNGRGWTGRTWPTNRGPTGRWELPLPATFQDSASPPSVGPMRPGTSGSLGECIGFRPVQDQDWAQTTAISGSTARTQTNGPG